LGEEAEPPSDVIHIQVRSMSPWAKRPNRHPTSSTFRYDQWSAGTHKQIVVRVVTDDGLTGTGEAFADGAPLAVCNVIDESR
jgi:L-alanine-DL-glutamate epimerase-like enolase superfamily enzyme